MANEQLSKEQILLLENLMYLADPLPAINGMGSGADVSDLLNLIEINDLVDDKQYGAFMTGADWKNIIQAVKSDDTLMNMEIVATNVDKASGGGGGVSALFANPATGEAVVAFCGSTNSEWEDNFVGGGVTDAFDNVSTQQQVNALEWYRSLELDEYSMITLTGHSKGGNKAKYITIMDGTVDRCISFDGQGFSDEFINEYGDLIASRQDKISNINAEYDYVNLLLNDIGSTTFYQGHDFGEFGFLENHCPNTMFKFHDDGTFEMIPVAGRAKEIEELDEFLNSYLRSLGSEDKQKALKVVGTMVEQGFNGAATNDILATLLSGSNADSLAYLIAYLIRYEQNVPEFADSISDILSKFGMEDYVKWIDAISFVMDWKYFDTIVDVLNFAGDHIPDWVLEQLSKLLSEKFDINLSIEELRKLLSVIGKVNADMDTIEIIADGKDIEVISGDFNSFSVKVKAVDALGDTMKLISNEMNLYSEELKGISANLYGTAGLLLEGRKMQNIANKLARQARSMMVMGNVMEQAAATYLNTENKTVNYAVTNGSRQY